VVLRPDLNNLLTGNYAFQTTGTALLSQASPSDCVAMCRERRSAPQEKMMNPRHAARRSQLWAGI
jgi:hypothetical protein